MADLDRAIAAAREALKVKSHPLDSRVTKTLRDLLAALDAARGEAVAWADPGDIAEKRHGALYTANATEQPGTRYSLALYAAPPASECVDQAYRDGYSTGKMHASPPAALAVPAGYALVPVEPTDEMVWAGKEAFTKADFSMRKLKQMRSPITETWAAMLAAAERKGGA